MKLKDLRKNGKALLPEKKLILWKLQESDYIKQLHQEIKEGLIGSLKNDYLMKLPMSKPYEVYSEEVKTFLNLPIFHAMVDMMTAMLLTRVQEKLIDLVIKASEIGELDLPLKQIIESGEIGIDVGKILGILWKNHNLFKATKMDWMEDNLKDLAQAIKDACPLKEVKK